MSTSITYLRLVLLFVFLISLPRQSVAQYTPEGNPTEFTSFYSGTGLEEASTPTSNAARMFFGGLFKVPGYILAGAGGIAMLGGFALYFPDDDEDCYCDDEYGDPIFLTIGLVGLGAVGLGYLFIEIGDAIQNPKMEGDILPEEQPVARLQFGLVQNGVGFRLLF